MFVALVTIPRTGSRFLERLIKPDKFVHVINDKVPRLLAEADLVVAPLRDPRETYIAWAVRGTPMEPFQHHWELLDRYDRVCGIHYVPIDLPALREIAVQELSAMLQRDLSTDWMPIGAHTGPKDKNGIQVPDLSSVYSLPLVKRFYS